MGTSNDEVLSIAMRPTRFSELVGQERVVNQILAQYKSGRMPRAWLLHGQTGSGKTTTAKILAAALQELKPEHFGDVKAETWTDFDSLCIQEINASRTNKVEELGRIADQSMYLPTPGSRKRIYILDEAQRLTKDSQNLLLTPFESGPKSTVWIICTTEPSKLLLTLRRRCVHLRVDGLSTDGIKKLVLRAKKFTNYQGKVLKFVERMDVMGVSSPSLILNAFEAYIAKASMPDSAEDVDLDPISVCRILVTGSWSNLASVLKAAPVDQARDLQMVLMGYMRSMLLGGHHKSKTIASLLLKLGEAPMFDGAPLMAWLCALLYTYCPQFK